MRRAVMISKKLQATILGTVVAVAAFVVGPDAKSDPAIPGGVVAVYGAGQGPIQANSTEFVSSSEAIISMASSGAPTAIWQTLEHGERVECLDCIGAVAPLLYDANPKNREISAWWLRRRMLGVFGPGEVYQQTLNTLTGDPSPARRAYAASAIGEFLVGSGVPVLATALGSDTDPGVRAAAASALGRLNDDGSNSGASFPSAFTVALGDSDPNVKIATLMAAGRVSVLADTTFPTKVVGLLGDPNATVRNHAVQLLDEMHLSSAVAGMIGLAKGDADENVRLNACHALGTFADSSAKPSLEYIAANDASGRVRDMATIALRKM
jgi:HEAT repeat protein